MSDVLEGAGQKDAGTHELAGERRHPRWTRTHTIWLLIVLSLSPGAVVALFRDHWTGLPAGVRAAIYLTSAILIVAVCTLILDKGGDAARGSTSQAPSREDQT